MSDQLEESLRDALSAQIDPDSIARLSAIDYHPRQRRIRKLPAVGALGATGIAATVAAIVALGSTAAPAFAGWQATPTTPAPGQLSQAAEACGQGLGTPVLTDSRGPYTASIYGSATTSTLCLSGDGVSMSSTAASSTPATVAAGQIEIGGGGTRDSAGNALTVVDGRAGTGVTAVTIERSDGSSVQATVTNGWYLAWWPGTSTATNAEVTTASGTSTVAFPSTPALSTPNCPAGAHCASGYGFGSAPGGGTTSSRTESGSQSGASGGSSSSESRTSTLSASASQ